MFSKNAFIHLRLPFSFLLMPVFLMALSFVFGLSKGILFDFEFLNIALIFISLHVFIYPASNAYNSYQDQDEGDIGLMKSPKKAGKDVFRLSILFDILGLGLALIVGLIPFYFVLLYVLFSKAYSWRKIRLKKYPIIGFLTVFFMQGAWIFLLVISVFIHDSKLFFNSTDFFIIYFILMYSLIPSFLFGGGYPISQIYQHKEDKADGVTTLSMKLGLIGTFFFSGIMFAIGMAMLSYFYFSSNQIFELYTFLVFMLPVFGYFNIWIVKVIKDKSEANYKHTMRMNIISAICFNLAFIVIIINLIGLI